MPAGDGSGPVCECCPVGRHFCYRTCFGQSKFSIQAYPANFGDNYVKNVTPTTIDTNYIYLTDGREIPITSVNEGETQYESAALTEIDEAWAS